MNKKLTSGHKAFLTMLLPKIVHSFEDPALLRAASGNTEQSRRFTEALFKSRHYARLLSGSVEPFPADISPERWHDISYRAHQLAVAFASTKGETMLPRIEDILDEQSTDTLGDDGEMLGDDDDTDLLFEEATRGWQAKIFLSLTGNNFTGGERLILCEAQAEVSHLLNSSYSDTGLVDRICSIGEIVKAIGDLRALTPEEPYSTTDRAFLLMGEIIYSGGQEDEQAA